MHMASVTLEGVRKVYDKNVVAVQSFDLAIEDKEFVVFVGPSGCGKSTTLRMIAGLESITDGTLKIGSRIVNDVEPKDRDIAMVFQNYALYPHLSVYENLAFSLRIRKMNAKEIHRRVMQAAEILGITPYLTRRPKALSGGQRQRVAIGRAIVREPAVFLMDEPLSNLDAKLRNQMRSEIILLRKRLDTTFIYVTHDQTEAMTLGDRIVIMKDGFIQQVGTPHQVFHHPRNLFVAGFIGNPPMNFLKGHLMEQSGQYVLRIQDAVFPLETETSAFLAGKAEKSRPVILGVRPEHMALSMTKQPNTIPALIQVNEMMGSELHLHLQTTQNEQLILRLPTLDVTDAQLSLLSAGNTLYLSFPGKVVHIFDPHTEENLLFH